MRVCVRVCVSTRNVSVFARVCACVNMRSGVRVCMYVYVCACARARVCACVFVGARARAMCIIYICVTHVCVDI